MMFWEVAKSRGEVIECVIAEACAIYERKHGAVANVVRIHTSHPVTVEVPAGVELVRAENVLPNEAWAGRES